MHESSAAQRDESFLPSGIAATLRHHLPGSAPDGAAGFLYTHSTSAKRGKSAMPRSSLCLRRGRYSRMSSRSTSCITSICSPSSSVLKPSSFTMICSSGAVYQRTCCRHLARLAAGSGSSSTTVDQQPTERLVIAFESVSAACVPACPPDMSPPSMNIPSFLRISASSAAAAAAAAESDETVPDDDGTDEAIEVPPHECMRSSESSECARNPLSRSGSSESSLSSGASETRSSPTRHSSDVSKLLESMPGRAGGAAAASSAATAAPDAPGRAGGTVGGGPAGLGGGTPGLAGLGGSGGAAPDPDAFGAVAGLGGSGGGSDWDCGVWGCAFDPSSAAMRSLIPIVQGERGAVEMFGAASDIDE